MYCLKPKHHTVYNQVTSSACFSFLLFIGNVCGNQRQLQPNVFIPIFTTFFFFSWKKGRLWGVGESQSKSPLDLSALGGYKMTDTSSKGSKCLYESRFVQNVQGFFFQMMFVIHYVWYVKTAINWFFLRVVHFFFAVQRLWQGRECWNESSWWHIKLSIKEIKVEIHYLDDEFFCSLRIN